MGGIARDGYRVPRRRKSVPGAFAKNFPVFHAPSRDTRLLLESRLAMRALPRLIPKVIGLIRHRPDRRGFAPSVNMSFMTLRKIVSGGQTGVDRAALDAALAAGFPCGGWAPSDRMAEDGVIPERYPVVALPITPGKGQRTLVREGEVHAPNDGTGRTGWAAARQEPKRSGQSRASDSPVPGAEDSQSVKAVSADERPRLPSLSLPVRPNADRRRRN